MFRNQMGNTDRIDLADDDGKLYEVVEVDISSKRVRMMTSAPLDAPNADAVERFAIMRRGDETNFFATVPAGLYKDGDDWGDHTL